MEQYIPNLSELKDIVDLQLAILSFLIFALILWSAAWSSSIAESRHYEPKIHGFLGFVLPLAYPFFIYSVLKTKVSKERLERENKKAAAARNEDQDVLPLHDLNPEYFKAIYIDSNGKHNGPFLIDTEDSIVKAEIIAEVHANYIVIETLGRNSKTQRLRIPYNKITSCCEA